MRRTLATTLISAALIAGGAFSQESPFDPTSVYERESLHGFTILVNPEVLIHKQEAADMRRELEAQLKAIVREVPAKLLPTLQRVWIWVEWEK